MPKTNDVVCNLCQTSNADFLFEAKDRLYGCEGVFKYVKCKTCGLVYMNPQISTDQIEKFYPDDYSPYSSKTKAPSKNRNSLIAGLRNIRKEIFKNVKIISSIRQKLNPQSKLLDVGCGSGKFLNQINSETGCQVYGVDISETAAKAAKDNFALDIFNGAITEAPFSENSFDIITAWWYLEHVPNPSQALRKMSSLLRHDGYCIIAVPNFDSFNAKIFRNKWYHLDCPRHLYIYSPDSIAKLLDKTGLAVTKIIFDKTPWGLLGSLRSYFGDDKIPLKHRRRLKGSTLIKRLLLPCTILSALLRQSDTMVIYARRK